MHEDDWWHTACMCNKAVYPDSKMFFCEKCYKHVVNVFVGYRVKVRVFDATGNAIFVIFYKDGMVLFNKTCVEMYEKEDKNSGNHAVPNELFDLVDKEFLFKVEYKNHVNPQFEQSFRVKKICFEASIINKFKELIGQVVVQDPTSESGSIVNGKEMTIGGSSVPVAQDLMSKSSYVGLEKGKSVLTEKQTQNEPKGNDHQACELSKDAMELTPANKAFGTKEDIGLSYTSEVIGAFDNESATVDCWLQLRNRLICQRIHRILLLRRDNLLLNRAMLGLMFLSSS